MQAALQQYHIDVYRCSVLSITWFEHEQLKLMLYANQSHSTGNQKKVYKNKEK